MHTLTEVIEDNIKMAIIERCGPEPDKQGMTCPFCGAREVYADKNKPRDCDNWYWLIRAFKVDSWSECRNCNNWFDIP